MKKSALVTLFALAMASSAALAGGTFSLVGTTTASTKTNNNAYAGVNWSLGSGWTPSVVLGLFHTRVKSDGDTQGANLAFHLNLAGGIKPGKVKLSYLNGKENIQGELGVGYDFMRSAPLLGLGLNGPFVAVGGDGYLNGNVVPFITIHSQGKFKKHNATSQQCVSDGATIDGHFDDNTCTNLFIFD